MSESTEAISPDDTPADVWNRMRRLVDQTPLRRVLLGRNMRRVLAGIGSVRFVPASRFVEDPFRFLAASMTRRGVTVHHLRATGRALVVDHGRGALELVDEVFGARCYEPPARVAALLPDQAQILDIGANVGAFSAFALDRWPSSTITAIEADPANEVALRRFVAEGGDGRVEVIAGAATTHDGSIRFRSGLGSGSTIAEDGAPIDAIDVFPLFARADLVKMDIERGEWPILADERLAQGGPLVLVMEYHRRFSGDGNARDVATGLLEAAGFEVGFVRPNYWGHGTLWAWRS